MPNDETIATLFELAIAAEKAAQDFYLGLVKRFSHYPEVSGFWKEMLQHETHHTKSLENMRNSLTQSQLNSPADPMILWKAKEVLMFSVEDKLNSVRTLEDAYELAHELEHSEVNTVYQFLRIRFSPANERRKFIEAEIDDHLTKLMNFSKTFGNAEWRKSIMIRSL